MRNSQNFVSQPARWKGATETEQQKSIPKQIFLRQSRAHYPHHACYYRTTVRLKWLKNKNLWYGDQSQSSLQSQGHPSTGFVTVHVLCFLCSYPFPSLIKMHFVGIVKLSVFEGMHPTLFCRVSLFHLCKWKSAKQRNSNAHSRHNEKICKYAARLC